MLACCGRSCDTDDLARTALKNQEIAEADVVAGDGDRVGCVAWLGRDTSSRSTFAATANGDVDFFTVVMATREGVSDTLSSSVETMAQGVIVTIFIVVTHVARRINSLFRYADFFAAGGTKVRRINSSTGCAELFTVIWLKTRSVVTFSDVNLSFVVSAVMGELYIDLGIVVSSLVW